MKRNLFPNGSSCYNLGWFVCVISGGYRCVVNSVAYDGNLGGMVVWKRTFASAIRLVIMMVLVMIMVVVVTFALMMIRSMMQRSLSWS